MSDTSLQKICSQKTSCSIFNIENFVQDCEALLGCMVLTQSVVLEWCGPWLWWYISRQPLCYYAVILYRYWSNKILVL